MLRWAAGHAIEGAIRPHLEIVFPGMKSNLRFISDKLDLSGEFDGLHVESGTLISVKSVHDYAMITRGGVVGLKENVGTLPNGKVAYDLKKEPYIHHQYQEHAYVLLGQDSAAWTDQNDNLAILREIKHIVYVYITLGGLIATYTTEPSPEILAKVRDKVMYLNKCWKQNILPMCVCQEGKPMWKEQNQYCPYRYEGGCCSESLLEENVQ